MNKKIINSLYEQYKNTPKKLKIVCDWDEVIQACEPYALWKNWGLTFEETFKKFWSVENCPISYYLYGSKLIITEELEEAERKPWNPNSIPLKIVEKQIQTKNLPNFYQEAPFLTIAEDLLKLVKEGKVRRLIFLSAYDKRKFPNGDERKEKIFKETFDKVGYPHEKKENHTVLPCYLELIGFDNETQGQSKADWIKENASDFDIVIDDNPNICKSLMELKDFEILDKEEVNELLEKTSCEFCGEKTKRENLAAFVHDVDNPLSINQPVCYKCWKEETLSIESNSQFYTSLDYYLISKILIFAPYYPAVETQHHPEVLLIKNEVSDLKKEYFTNEK